LPPSSAASAAGRPAEVRNLAHLGDFSATPRMLLIAALALPVGAVSACVAWALLRLIGLITNALFYQRLDTHLVAPGGVHHNPALILLVPVAGGLVVGLMARFGSEKIRGHGMPEAIEAILIGGSKIQPRVAVLKPVASAIAIGSGGPFGAEGPIIMTGGAIGSLFAQFLRLTADERKTLLVAGATAGMAATFNAPLASVLLAVELLLFEWRPRSYVPVSAAVAVAVIVRGPLLGTGALFPVSSALHITNLTYLFCVLSGIASAVVAVIATELVYLAEDTFRRLPIHWMWWPAIGGVVIGIGGLITPEALGVGYNIIDLELTGKIGLGLVVGILVVKTAIWSLSLGSGTSGGILAPMFMIGGALGSVEAQVFPHVGPGFWALIGLAGVLGGLMRSPFTGVIFAIELTRRFDALLPLLIGASVAYGLSVLILKRSVLTEKVVRRGYHLTREYDVDPLEVLFVDEVIEAEVVTFTQTTPVATALSLTTSDELAAAQRLFPVVDDDDRLVGIVTQNQLQTVALNAGRVPLGDIARRDPICVFSDDTLRQAAAVMADSHLTRLPVVTRADPDRPIGVVSLQMLLAGRIKDLHEAQVSERVLRVPLLWSRRGDRAIAVTPTVADDLGEPV
jgi:H+/Cl- antiporter ClcA